MARAVLRSLVDELLAGRSPGPPAHSIKESADFLPWWAEEAARDRQAEIEVAALRLPLGP